MRKPKAPNQNPEFYSRYLKIYFLGYLMGSPKYQAAVHDLMAEWKALTTDRPELSSIVGFHNLPTPEHIDDPLYVYIVKVRSIVADTLRCRVEGEPADWVCHALHEAACGRPPSPPTQAQPETIVRMDVNVVVFARGLGLVQTLKGSYPVAAPFTISEEPFAAFTSWKQLRKAARDHVDKAIDLMQDEVDSVTSSWPRPYEKGEETRREKTMPKLVAWLVEGEEMVFGDRSATNDLLHELALDAPGKSEKSARKAFNFSEAGDFKTP